MLITKRVAQNAVIPISLIRSVSFNINNVFLTVLEINFGRVATFMPPIIFHKVMAKPIFSVFRDPYQHRSDVLLQVIAAGSLDC